MAEYNIDELSSWHYGETKEEANKVVEEILMGRRTAFISDFSYLSDYDPYEVRQYTNLQLQSLVAEYRDMYPKKGDLNVITDWDGNPKAVIRTLGFGLMHLEDVPLELASCEHGDLKIEDWRRRKEEEILENSLKEYLDPREVLQIELFEVLEKL